MAKASKSSVDYSPAGEDGDRCDRCLHWQAPDGCEVVAGVIKPGDWCILWVSPQGMHGAKAHRPAEDTP